MSRLPPGLRLRAENDADRPWLAELFIETRTAELVPTGWTQTAIHAFLHEQFSRQHEYYRQVYSGADYCVIEHDGTPIGRLYLRRAANEMRLMDIALVATWRGRGIGTALLRALIEEADADRCEITLHVEPGNPAQRLYRRLGFRLIEQRGVYDFLGRPGAAVPAGPS